MANNPGQSQGSDAAFKDKTNPSARRTPERRRSGMSEYLARFTQFQEETPNAFGTAVARHESQAINYVY